MRITRFVFKKYWKLSVNLHILTLLHSERPKLQTILAFLSAVGLSTALALFCSFILCSLYLLFSPSSLPSHQPHIHHGRIPAPTCVSCWDLFPPSSLPCHQPHILPVRILTSHLRVLSGLSSFIIFSFSALFFSSLLCCAASWS